MAFQTALNAELPDLIAPEVGQVAAHQCAGGKFDRLASAQNRVRDPGGQEGKREHAADIFAMHAVCLRNLRDGPSRAICEHLEQKMCLGHRFDETLIDMSGSCIAFQYEPGL